MQSKLSFFGAAGSVTGSNFLLEAGDAKFLIDCGLFQGTREGDNQSPFPYNPGEPSHLVITHAHLDHIGRIPKLVKDGFRGTILSTKATRTLAEPLLRDALEIMIHNAQRKGQPPLYEAKDVGETMRLWEGISYHEKIALPAGVELELLDAGHILGSAMAKFSRGGKSVVFTGDLGGGNSPLLEPCESVVGATYLVMEGTYGDRTRPDDERRFEQLEDAIEAASVRGGTLLIPAFSTERTQDLLFDIRRLMLDKKIPSMPVYLDSPLAEEITAAYTKYPDYFAPDIRARLEGGEEIFSFPELHYVKSADESRGLSGRPGQKIILAGSGMSSGGRIGMHEQHYLPDPNSTVLIVGYQAAGTIGRRLIEGEKTVEIYKEKIPVRATIQTLYGYSAHKDSEQLVEFANQAQAMGTKEIFIVHGEPQSAMFLAQRVRDYLGVKATVPEVGDSAVLDF